MAKYPWIPRKYYPAVMYASKMIRETGFFNKAIETAADYYDVDEDEVAKHVRARQAAGQKAKSVKFKYRWFVACKWTWNDANGYGPPTAYIVKGKSLETVRRRFFDEDLRRTAARDYGGSYAPSFWTEVYGPYDSKDVAEKDADNCMRKVMQVIGDIRDTDE